MPLSTVLRRHPRRGTGPTGPTTKENPMPEILAGLSRQASSWLM
jgi:hypothetical protein